MLEGWKRIHLGDVFDVSTTKLGSHSEEPAVFAISKYDGVVLSGDYHDRRVASAKLDGYKVLDTDAWAYSTIHIDEGSIARNNHGFAGVVSPMYTILKWASEDCIPAYFEHLLRTPELLSTYKDMAQGSINRRRSLPWKSFSAIEVEVPPRDEQQRIVDLVGSLNDAIEAAEASAAAARAATDEIRKDLLSVARHSEAPVMRDVLTLHYGKPMRDADRVAGEVPVVGSSGTFGWHDTSNVTTSGSIIVGRKGTAGSVTWYDTQVWATDTAFWVEPKTDVHLAYLYQALINADLPSMTAQTGVPGLNRDRAYSARIPLPTVEDQMEIAEMLGMSAATEQMSVDYANSLRATRSELLAALLSGEHEIPESYDVDTAVQL